MPKSHQIGCYFAFLIALVLPSVITGETILLKGGSVLVGTITCDDTQCTVQTDAGMVTVAKDSVVMIQPDNSVSTWIKVDSSSGNLGSPTPATPASSETPVAEPTKKPTEQPETPTTTPKRTSFFSGDAELGYRFALFGGGSWLTLVDETTVGLAGGIIYHVDNSLSIALEGGVGLWETLSLKLAFAFRVGHPFFGGLWRPYVGFEVGYLGYNELDDEYIPGQGYVESATFRNKIAFGASLTLLNFYAKKTIFNLTEVHFNFVNRDSDSTSRAPMQIEVGLDMFEVAWRF